LNAAGWHQCWVTAVRGNAPASGCVVLVTRNTARLAVLHQLQHCVVVTRLSADVMAAASPASWCAHSATHSQQVREAVEMVGTRLQSASTVSIVWARHCVSDFSCRLCAPAVLHLSVGATYCHGTRYMAVHACSADVMMAASPASWYAHTATTSQQVRPLGSWYMHAAGWRSVASELLTVQDGCLCLAACCLFQQYRIRQPAVQQCVVLTSVTSHCHACNADFRLCWSCHKSCKLFQSHMVATRVTVIMNHWCK
jgi:hypothetical protein